MGSVFPKKKTSQKKNRGRSGARPGGAAGGRRGRVWGCGSPRCRTAATCPGLGARHYAGWARSARRRQGSMCPGCRRGTAGGAWGRVWPSGRAARRAPGFVIGIRRWKRLPSSSRRSLAERCGARGGAVRCGAAAAGEEGRGGPATPAHSARLRAEIRSCSALRWDGSRNPFLRSPGGEIPLSCPRSGGLACSRGWT